MFAVRCTPEIFKPGTRRREFLYNIYLVSSSHFIVFEAFALQSDFHTKILNTILVSKFMLHVRSAVTHFVYHDAWKSGDCETIAPVLIVMCRVAIGYNETALN
jgi:hypothetical protein